MKKTQESGRSMVEMLGVLAIIGVLSIGGIAGYTMAMNRYRANEVIDMANKVASLAFAQNQTSIARTGQDLVTAGTALNTITPLSLGLIPNDDNNGAGNMPGGATLEITDIDEDAVTMTLTFPTEGVCTAGQNILGQGACAANAVAGVVFRQS